MDQIWLASPCPALRLWPGDAGAATWRLNASAMAWGRRHQLTGTSWRAIAAALGGALTGGPEREGQLAEPAPLRWRSLPMSTGWLVWLMPDEAPAVVPPRPWASDVELLELVRTFARFGSFECDFGTGVTRWDRHLFELLAFDIAGGEPSPEQVLARVHPEDRYRVESDFKRFTARLGRHSICCRLRCDDGSERFLQTSFEVRPDDAGRPARLIGVVVDQAASAGGIRGQEAPDARFADALRSAEVSAWRVDLETGASEWSPQMFLLHGLPADSPAPAFGAYIEEFVHPGDRAAFTGAWRAMIDAGSPRFDAEFRIVRSDGSHRNVEYRSRREERGGRDSIVGIALDATDRVAQPPAVERPLRETSARGTATAARSEFLARLSHELRTPLNAVLGFAQLVEHDGTTVPATVQLERVVRIREAGEQLLRLVGDVLEHLRRESSVDDAVPTSPSPLDDDLADRRGARAALSVLYIEDNPVNVILVEELVAMRPNTSLRCAITGLDGVAMAAAATPHVVLVDMHLPDIDGFEVLRRLRTDRALDRSAVIALSANGMGDDIALALAAGFDDYWTKPIDFRHFLNGLDSLARAR